MKQILFELVVVLFVFQNLYSKTIKIPNDQPMIQVGIVSSSSGDTILVSPGTYYENINFNGKNIVLGSLFLTTGDTSYISQTIIDGNQQGCVVVFESGEDSTATLTGFTITNGYTFLDSHRGGGITCINSSSPRLANLIVSNNSVVGDGFDYGGGGISCLSGSFPKMENLQIKENTATNYASGGGIFCSDSSGIIISDSEISNNHSFYGGGLSLMNSSSSLNGVAIVGNRSNNGGGIYLNSSIIKITNSIIKLNVANGSLGGGGILALNYSEFSISNSQIIENKSIWEKSLGIGPLGDGGGIHLRDYSVATIEDCKINNNSSIVNGGGIYVIESTMIIKNSEIIGNNSKKGGGLYYYPKVGIEVLKNVIIENNFSITNGGGLATNQNLLIPEASGCSISLNKAKEGGTDIYMEVEDTNSIQSIYLDTVTVSNPDNYIISPIKNINLYYNHAIFQSVDQDLYVSPNGSDSNNGTSKDESLKTIRFALLVASADNFNHRTIHLAPGTYSASANGEEFPLYGRSYFSLIGEKADTTILDGENENSIIEWNNCNSVTLENFTVQNGFDEYKGGVSVSGIDIHLKNMIIKDNISEMGVGGLNLYNSDYVNLENLTIAKNISTRFDSSRSGGLYTFGVKNLSILNSIIVSNSPFNLQFNSFHLFSGGTSTVLIGYSNIEGGESEIIKDDSVFVHWLDGNIDTDPLFVGGNPFDYNLTDSSPCINAGTPFLVWEGDTLINLSPSEYIGEAPDMGALESDVLNSVEGEKILPTEFKLEQNYPNPFNPSTTIKYEIPDQVRNDNVLVKLKIYDVLGREVTTLVNKEQKPGNYEVKFDAKNLSSGIYYYRISSGSFVKTKKMILIK